MEMYKRDCVKISNYAEEGSSNFYDVLEFVLCTINMPLSRVIPQRLSIKQDGLDSKWLSKVKASGVNYGQTHKDDLYNITFDIKAKHGSGLAGSYRAVNHLTQIPSIGLVKAGFIAQMCGFNVACLDRHNIREFGLDEKLLKLSKTIKPELKLKRCKEYTTLCQKKGSEFYWDFWCNFVAERGGMNKDLPTGDAVSEYHVKAVMEL
jgi:hypothetical protein